MKNFYLVLVLAVCAISLLSIQSQFLSLASNLTLQSEAASLLSTTIQAANTMPTNTIANEPQQQQQQRETRSTATATTSTVDQYQDKYRHIPIEELVDTFPETSCRDGLELIQDIRQPNQTASFGPLKIPRVIHMTSKSRCVSPRLAAVIQKWRTQLPGHLFYFHNDAALHRLLWEKEWHEFPQLKMALECSNQMVEQADLWRALVIWEYGGIYTDINNDLAQFNVTTVGASDQALFEMGRGGWLSQYFFAAEPKHPLIFLLILQVWQRLTLLSDVEKQYPPSLTGPGALKGAMKHFMETHLMEKGEPCVTYSAVCPGVHQGLANRTVTVKEFMVQRSVVRFKKRDYRAMNMTQFQDTWDVPKTTNRTTSCINYLYEHMWLQSQSKYLANPK